MDRRFAGYLTGLARSLRRLLAMKPLRRSQLPPDMPAAGIYVFSEHGRYMYVGRSKNLRSRIQRHSRPGATHRSAAFAFHLARRATGHTQPSYRAEGSRAALMADQAFREAFRRAKERIARMDVQYVNENDPLRQALLEIYATVVLRTPFNDFDTH